MTVGKGVVLFHSIHTLFQLEKELQRCGLEVEPIPTPRWLSSDCGSALMFSFADVKEVRSAIERMALDVKGIHELKE